MSNQVMAGSEVRSGYSARGDTAAAARELTDQLGNVDAGAVMFFCSPSLSGEVLSRSLAEAYPGAPVLGCTTAGQFTERGSFTDGVAAVALPRGVVRQAAGALAPLARGVDEGVTAAIADIEKQLGVSLRDVDPERYVGFVLIDGLHGSEERVNEVLGNLSPLMSFVGGSAGDDLQFAKTEVFCGDASSDHGAALMVIEASVPFAVVKSCSFRPSGRRFTVTDADVAQRIVWKLDGRPAAEVYAEAVGCSIDELPKRGFPTHPLGLMIDDEPWIRSPQQVVDGRGVKFYCQILPGMEVDLMDETGLIDDTRAALRRGAAGLGGQVSGAVMFNCILRRLELDQEGGHQAFVDSLGGFPVGGFHTYGESWLGHINQTLTAVLFGR